MNNSNPLKILQFASADLWAGAETQIYTLVSSLIKQRDVDITVILLNHGTLEQKLLSDDVKVIVIDETKLNGLQIYKKLSRIIKDIQPDIIHTHRIKENIIGSIAALSNGRVPSLRTAHGAQEHLPAWHNLPKQLLYFLDWFSGRFIQKKIIAVSADLCGLLKKSFPDNKVITINNGINIEPSSQKKRLQNEDATLLRTYDIGIAGRLSPVKRVDIFIKTAAYLKKNHPDLHLNFHIYGDGPLMPQLKRLSQELNTDGFVCFQGHNDNMKDELQNLDMLLMTSDHEGLPMILLEAITTHIPVISHAVGGIPELLDLGKCGELVTDHSERGYADKIIQLIENPKRRDEITHLAFSRIAKIYSADKNAEYCYQQYVDICK